MTSLRTLTVALSFTLVACSSAGSDGSGGGTGGGVGGGGGGDAEVDAGVDAGNADVDAGAPWAFYDGGTGGMPCPIAVMVKEKCMVCHGDPVAGNATFSLQSRADFLQPSGVDPTKNLYQQARIRLHNPFNPMPPVGYQQPTSDEVYAFDHWEVAFAPPDTCSPTALPAQPTTCASNSFWGFGNNGSDGMNPGLACRSCHLGQNFNGQNPTGVKETIRAYFFMGTVFADAHAKDLCNSPPPAGAKVEIIDKNGHVALTLIPNGAGNFYSGGTSTSVALPYTARITANGKSASMLTAQTSGDCNTCHTTQGLQNAPGRIYWPQP